jgi:hypothetical protein
MENFNYKKYLAEGKLLKENINNPLKPFFKGEEMLSSPQISQYWDIMVKNQPEDVIKTLTDLTAGRLSFEEFLSSTESDIYDSFRDDDMEDLDEDTLKENSDVEAKFQNFIDKNLKEFRQLEDSMVMELSMEEAREEGLDDEMINYLKDNYRFDYKDIIVYYNEDSNEIFIENLNDEDL